MATVLVILAIMSLIVTILAGMAKAPLWVAVLLIAVTDLLLVLPLK